MEAVQRKGALGIASSYRTVSGPAVLVIANVLPIDLLAFERKRTYDRMQEIGKQRAAAEAHASTLATWQYDGRKGRKDGGRTDWFRRYPNGQNANMGR